MISSEVYLIVRNGVSSDTAALKPNYRYYDAKVKAVEIVDRAK